ncbi:Teneurin-4 [Manis pentadactyla]|nr:Teneurin-4 [Manis pentadactyla]
MGAPDVTAAPQLERERPPEERGEEEEEEKEEEENEEEGFSGGPELPPRLAPPPLPPGATHPTSHLPSSLPSFGPRAAPPCRRALGCGPSFRGPRVARSGESTGRLGPLYCAFSAYHPVSSFPLLLGLQARVHLQLKDGLGDVLKSSIFSPLGFTIFVLQLNMAFSLVKDPMCVG